MRISDLAPNAKNPRTVTDEKLAMLKKALLEFGDLSGIVYNRKSKQLVGGHQRTKQFGADAEIHITRKYSKPTATGTIAEGYVELQGERFTYREVSWNKHREMAANIAANKGAGAWDLAQLEIDLKELSTFDADMDLDLTLFGEDERAALFASDGSHLVKEHTRVGPTGVDEDDAPEKAEPRAKLGDVYRLGEHRLMCGDSTDERSLARLMKGAKADMVFTDPPYGVKEKGNRGEKGRSRAAVSPNFRDVIGDDSESTAKAAFSMAASNGNTVIYWGANNYSFLPISRGWIVWDKRENKGTDDNGDAELAWTNSNRPIRAFYHLWKGMIKGSERGESRVHPTQKPIALAEWCFENYGEPKSVLDLFGGSGSTLIACEKTGRKCYMMELDPQYVDVIIARWEKYTGREAKRVNHAKAVQTKLRRAEQAGSRATDG